MSGPVRDRYAALKSQLLTRGTWGQRLHAGGVRLRRRIANCARAASGLEPITP